MKNTLKTKGDVMKSLQVSGTTIARDVSSGAPALGAFRGMIAGNSADMDTQERFVQELLATFSDRWEW